MVAQAGVAVSGREKALAAIAEAKTPAGKVAAIGAAFDDGHISGPEMLAMLDEAEAGPHWGGTTVAQANDTAERNRAWQIAAAEHTARLRAFYKGVPS